MSKGDEIVKINHDYNAGNTYILISKKKDSLPGGETIICGGHPLTLLTVENPPGDSVKVGGKWIRLPRTHEKAVLVENDFGGWNIIAMEEKGCGKGIEGPMTLFIINAFWQHGHGVGVRTSFNWKHTHWGVTFNTDWLRGLYFIPCILPCKTKKLVEFKAVREPQRGSKPAQADVEWESPAFCNKQAFIRPHTQVVTGIWDTTIVLDNVAVPHYKKTIRIEVEIPKDFHEELESEYTQGSFLVMRDCRGPDNSKLYYKGHQGIFEYDKILGKYLCSVSVPRGMEKMKFKLAVVDCYNSVTHLDHLSFSNENNRARSRLVDFNKRASVNCSYFVDVRPFKWCIEHSGAMGELPIQIKALYELLTEPIKDNFKVDRDETVNSNEPRMTCDNSASCRKQMVIAGDIKKIMAEQSTR